MAAATGVRAAQRDANPAALTEKGFSDRVNAYLDVHRRCEDEVGSLPESANPAAITRRQQALGAAIRRARPDARQGDVFGSDVGALIRRLVGEDLARRRPVERQAFVVSQPEVRVRINDFYPTTAPLATVPPGMLKTLPPLPKGLEYRFVGSSLILFDVDPNLIVDILPDAIPLRYRKR